MEVVFVEYRVNEASAVRTMSDVQANFEMNLENELVELAAIIDKSREEVDDLLRSLTTTTTTTTTITEVGFYSKYLEVLGNCNCIRVIDRLRSGIWKCVHALLYFRRIQQASLPSHQTLQLPQQTLPTQRFVCVYSATFV